jgi:hypothetical protein
MNNYLLKLLNKYVLTFIQGGEVSQYLGNASQPRVFRTGGIIWHLSNQPRFFNNHLKNPKIIINIHNYRGWLFGRF